MDPFLRAQQSSEPAHFGHHLLHGRSGAGRAEPAAALATYREAADCAILVPQQEP